MPFDRELIFGDPEDLHNSHHLHSNNHFDLLNNSSSSSSLHQLDLTLPTPPRSPRQQHKNSFDMMGGGGGAVIPDSVMDDLFNLLGEENNDHNSGGIALDDLFGGFSSSGGSGGSGGRKRKISDSWFNLSDHEHHELFGQIAENFSSLSAASPSHQQQLNNHLNNSFKFNELDGPSSSLLDSLMSSTYSPPPTQPPSPMSTPCKNRGNNGPPLSPCSTVIKSEPPTQPGSIVSELDDYQSGVVDDDVVGAYASGDAADFLADFDNFDSFEKLAFCDDDEEEEEEQEEEEDYKPMMKRSKFDSESSTDDNYFIKKENCGSLDQIMWNCNNNPVEQFIVKEEKIEVEQVPHDDDANIMLLHGDDEDDLFDAEERERISSLRAAFNNDHSYACVVTSDGDDDEDNFEDNKKVLVEAAAAAAATSSSTVGVSSSSTTTTMTSTMLNFDKMGIKKTKILVPLKDLMESLQQKSYLVSPLGPGKKIITLTNGETVKGVLTSCPAAKSLASSSPSSSSKPSNHNVRKRPHHPLKFANPPRLLLSGDELELAEDSNSSSTASLGLTNGHHHHNNHHHSSNNHNNVDSSSSSPSSSKKKTKAHNNMERMRRIDLRNSFDNLKKLVPVLSKSPKCSKVEILKKAEEYIRGLRGLEKKLQKEEQQLRLKLQQNKLRQEQAVAEQHLLATSCA